jgi:hypothetical protein
MQTRMGARVIAEVSAVERARPVRGGLGVAGLCVLIGALGCGANAGGALEEGEPPSADQPRSIETVTAAAKPAGVAEDEATAESASVLDEGASLSVPSTPSITDPPSDEPAPLPSAELDTSRPLLGQLAPSEVVIPPGDCRFEFLGEWVRCENAGWPNVLKTDAPDLVACMQRCLERDDCTAVTDYLWLGGPELGCYLYLSSCDEPTLAATWGEEDGGRDFRRSCVSPGAPP